MSTDISARDAISWFPLDGKRKIGRIDWTQMVKQDINRGGFGWKDLPSLTGNSGKN